MNLDLNLMLHTKDNSDLHVKCKTKKLLEKNRKHSLGSRVRGRGITLHSENVIHKVKSWYTGPHIN